MEYIYNTYLQEVGGIKFTAREMDVIACIMHNRGEKKIAMILSISPRTVGSHARNIMSKLGCSSKELIIDFIEKSGQLLYIRQYYFFLLSQSLFKNYLQKIGKLINFKGFCCSIIFTKVNKEEKFFLQQLRQYLEIANITLKESEQSSEDSQCNIYVVSEETIITENLNKNIKLILNQGIDLSKLQNLDYIDFRFKEDFYLSVLQLLKRIIQIPELEQIITEFQKEYQALQYLWQEGDLKRESLVSNFPSVKAAHHRGSLSVILSILICLIIIIFGPFIKQNFIFLLNRPTIIENTQLKHTSIISDLDKLPLLDINKDFSADNVTKEQMQKNYNYLKCIEKITKHLNEKEVQDYLVSDDFTQKKLTDFLYRLHALANYYTDEEHDGEKARSILKPAKSLAEHYIINRSKIKFDFDNLNKEEIYTELAIIKDLPEIYTRIIYLLGRTYIYQGNKQEAIKYFELSKYLGNKLKLFEEHLSSRSGLAIITEEEIDYAIKAGNYNQARKELHDIIKLYKQLKDANTSYKIGYKPDDQKVTIIIPKEDIYNRVACGEKIAKYSAKLIAITNDIDSNKQYINEIVSQFIGNDISHGILQESKAISEKRIASTYNTLGNILLLLYDKHINFKLFKNAIVKELNLQENYTELGSVHLFKI